ncbi:hypothetical protein [Cardinium endosymbiont of Culicoides punctatus]|uniref:hypothetical protein n=1 Tax=Cardinium endosymbiont of Culicoides punctatus TaxID=2304601 RepID=UPI0014050C87|nr:hypothetical protein [Cardinium endosymbiont of Culicoides punctatus]
MLSREAQDQVRGGITWGTVGWVSVASFGTAYLIAEGCREKSDSDSDNESEE